MPTPAMAAGLTIKLMSMEDVVALSLRRAGSTVESFDSSHQHGSFR